MYNQRSYQKSTKSGAAKRQQQKNDERNQNFGLSRDDKMNVIFVRHRFANLS